MNATEYGIHCAAGDEKTLVANVNRFLATQGCRKLYKREPNGLRDPDNPDAQPRYSHYYCQFLQPPPRWYFDLYPNVDLDGRVRLADGAQVRRNGPRALRDWFRQRHGIVLPCRGAWGGIDAAHDPRNLGSTIVCSYLAP